MPPIRSKTRSLIGSQTIAPIGSKTNTSFNRFLYLITHYPTLDSRGDPSFDTTLDPHPSPTLEPRPDTSFDPKLIRSHIRFLDRFYVKWHAISQLVSLTELIQDLMLDPLLDSTFQPRSLFRSKIPH